MKKIYLKMFSILLMGSIGISAYAQGIWKTTGTETAISASTDIPMGITGLSCMHSDAATVIGKTDVGAASVSYHGVTWNNESMVQGGTNGMYYAFRSTSDGILDIPVKMGSAKKTFILELTDACPYSAVLADVTAAFPTGDQIFIDPAYFTLPLVYDTYHKTSRTWSGATADTMQFTGANVYLVMSFPVVPNKTYVVGVIGSKLMLKGVNYIVTTSVKETPAIKGISFNGTQVLNEKGQKIELYNMAGKLIIRSSSSIPTDNLPRGVYVVRTTGSNGVMKFCK
ncbi:MAG: T9SS type A sorting domain-containing protein [Bacteroidales bacterium]|nr:T9SS type A sorting domain-containing protein [Bacteroidales bacterium]